MKKLTLEAFSEKGASPDYLSYLVRAIDIPIEINCGNSVDLMLLRVLCHLPLATENKESDYYTHLNNFIEFSAEEDAKDSGELLFVLYDLLENYNDGEFEDFFRVMF